MERASAAMGVGRLRKLALLGAVLLIPLAGCASIGPPTVKRDRFDYVVAISDSVKRQTLLNLVKTRYADAPVYMEIESVINQYAIEGELGFEFAPSSNVDNLLLGTGKYTDRPTITYRPLSGEQYARSLIKPLPIGSIFLLLQSGYPADVILRVCVQSINGLDNRRSGVLVARDADPGFDEALALMRELQDVRALYYQVESATDKLDVKIGFKASASPAANAKADQLRKLLSLDPNATEFPVVFAVQPHSNAEVAMMSRGMEQIIIEYAADIDAPQSDVEQGRVTPTVAATTGGEEAVASRLIWVHTGANPPDHAHVAVFYREQWFWVDDRDLYSKTSMQFLMTLFSFTERGTTSSATPVITVPTY